MNCKEYSSLLGSLRPWVKCYPRFKGRKHPKFSTQRQHNTPQDTSIQQVHCDNLKSSNYIEYDKKK